MLVELYEANKAWDKNRWPNFAAAEMTCRCGCGEVWWSPADFDAIQRVRRELDRPVSLNSTHRCRRHNAKEGGAPRSEHKRIAFDISLQQPRISTAEMRKLRSILATSGLTTFGLYGSFIHTDRRPGRFWVRPSGEKWRSLFLNS